jgi:hypothetical protein
MIEFITDEGWFNYTRFHFEDGSIDYVMIDKLSNPNSVVGKQIACGAGNYWIRFSDKMDWNWIKCKNTYAKYLLEDIFTDMTVEEIREFMIKDDKIDV